MGEVLLFVEKYHPDTMLSNDNAMKHIRTILKQKQLTLDKFFDKKARKAIAKKEKSTASKRQRRDKNQKENYPGFSWRRTPI